MLELRIRYARPDSRPKTYPHAGLRQVPTPSLDGYWTISGEDTAVRLHLRTAMFANDCNDYSLNRLALAGAR